MTKAFKVAGELTLKDGVSKTAKIAEKSMTRTAKLAQSKQSRLNRELIKTNRNLQTQSAKWAKIKTASVKAYQGFIGKAGFGVAAFGAATVVAAKNVGNFDDRMRALGISAGKNDKQLDAFANKTKKQIQNSAIAYRTSSDQITSALEAIVEKTGDLDFAANNIDNIAIAIRATNAEGADIGGIMSEIQKMGETDPKKVMALLDVLARQGKMGAFTLRNLSALGERVFAAYSPKNLQQVREMGALLQFIRMSTGSSEQATTALEAMKRTLTDDQKIGKLNKAGLITHIIGKDGKKELRAITDIMVDLINITQGDELALSKLINEAEARRVTTTFTKLFNQGKNIKEEVGNLVKIDATGTLTRDMKDMSKGMGAAMEGLKQAYHRFADDTLAKGVQNLADTLNEITPEQFHATASAAKNAAIGLTAAYIAGKAFSATMTIIKIAKSFRNPASVQKVFVTNSAQIGNSVSSKVSKIIGVGTAGVVGWQAGKLANKHLIEPGVKLLTGGKSETLGDLVYSKIHKNDYQPNSAKTYKAITQAREFAMKRGMDPKEAIKKAIEVINYQPPESTKTRAELSAKMQIGLAPGLALYSQYTTVNGMKAEIDTGSMATLLP